PAAERAFPAVAPANASTAGSGRPGFLAASQASTNGPYVRAARLALPWSPGTSRGASSKASARWSPSFHGRDGSEAQPSGTSVLTFRPLSFKRNGAAQAGTRTWTAKFAVLAS